MSRPACLPSASPEAARSTAARSFRRVRPPLPMRAQRGVVLFFALIVLVILLIGGIAVVRMSNASLLGAGNLAFRRDLTGQSDAAIAKAMQALFSNDNNIDRTADHPDKNYRASIQPGTDTQGMPNALLQSTPPDVTPGRFDGGNIDNDYTNNGVTVRYLIERMCKNAGAISAANCLQLPGNRSNGGSNLHYIPPPQQPGSVIYRLSVRVTGPRGTQAFFQTTFSGPG